MTVFESFMIVYTVLNLDVGCIRVRFRMAKNQNKSSPIQLDTQEELFAA